ncbi:UPF0164 family protein [Treponema paraluiscuniculi]|nr:UPF0164 family protein [Treponema paraluiscuniculi]
MVRMRRRRARSSGGACGCAAVRGARSFLSVRVLGMRIGISALCLAPLFARTASLGAWSSQGGEVRARVPAHRRVRRAVSGKSVLLSSATTPAIAMIAQTSRSPREVNRRAFSLRTGGRYEMLGLAFTALADDASFFEANAAGSAAFPYLLVGGFHFARVNQLHTDTIALVHSIGRTGYGFSASVQYPHPPTGEKTVGGVAIFNVAHRFLSAYRFKGISVGTNVKVGYRDSSAGGGGKKHVVATADIGLQGTWSVAKNFGSHEPNLWVGGTVKNVGLSVEVDASSSGSSVGVGRTVHPTNSSFILACAYQPIRWFLFGTGIEWKYNVQEFAGNNRFRYGVAFLLLPVQYVAFGSNVFLTGLAPDIRASAGVEFKSTWVRVDLTYTYESSGKNQHAISCGIAGFFNRDRRKHLEKEVYTSYLRGLRHYDAQHYEEAIAEWRRTLQRAGSFEPAREGIERATKLLQLNRQVYDFHFLH